MKRNSSEMKPAVTATHPVGPSRWEKARIGMLGAGLLGLVAETLLCLRAAR